MDQKHSDEILSFKEFLDQWVGSEKTLRRRLEDGSIPKYQPGGPGTLVGIPRSALSIPAPNPTKPNDIHTNKSKQASAIAGPPPKWRS